MSTCKNPKFFAKILETSLFPAPAGPSIAIDLNLIYTKGSDYHGPIVKPEIALGYGKNGNIVSDEEDFILKQLLEYKKNKTNF